MWILGFKLKLNKIQFSLIWVFLACLVIYMVTDRRGTNPYIQKNLRYPDPWTLYPDPNPQVFGS